MSRTTINVIASASTLHVQGLDDNPCGIVDRLADRMARINTQPFKTPAEAWAFVTGGPYHASTENRRWCQSCVDALDCATEQAQRAERTARRAQLDRKVMKVTDADVTDLVTWDAAEVREAAVSSFRDLLIHWGGDDDGDDYATMSAVARRITEARREFYAVGDTMRGICLGALRDAGFDL